MKGMEKDVLASNNQKKAQEAILILYKRKLEAVIYRVREKSVKFIFTILWKGQSTVTLTHHYIFSLMEIISENWIMF